ncbi:unnamed protein product, partial [Urochloa humidicola]
AEDIPSLDSGGISSPPAIRTASLHSSRVPTVSVAAAGASIHGQGRCGGRPVHDCLEILANNVDYLSDAMRLDLRASGLLHP